MTVITRRPENRLAKTIWAPGGKTIEKALEDAAANLNEVREERLAVLRAKLAQLQAVGRQGEANAKLGDIRALYALSSDVNDIAGVFGMAELGQAAYSLCELLDNLASRKVWNWPAGDDRHSRESSGFSSGLSGAAVTTSDRRRPLAPSGGPMF